MIKTIKEEILSSLKVLVIPGDSNNIVDMGRVSDICIVQRKVYLSIQVDVNVADQLETFRKQAEDIVKDISEIDSAVVTLTDNKAINSHSDYNQEYIKGIGFFIGVASGKGGVGKSTTAVNIACALSNSGNKIAILDADIYGPSIPKLLNIDSKAEILKTKKLKPIEKYGIKIMSIASLVDNKTAMIWRGPMVQSAVINMIKHVDWGKIDVAIIK